MPGIPATRYTVFNVGETGSVNNGEPIWVIGVVASALTGVPAIDFKFLDNDNENIMDLQVTNGVEAKMNIPFLAYNGFKLNTVGARGSVITVFWRPIG